MTAPICRVCGKHRPHDVADLRDCIKIRMTLPAPTPEEVVSTLTDLIKDAADPIPETKRSEWLRNVLEHCDRATSTSLATMRALGKDSTKIRKAVGK